MTMKTKILLSIIAISSFAGVAQNNDPYGVFGYKPKVEYKIKKSELFTVNNPDNCADIKKLSFDFGNKRIYALDLNDAILKVIPITDEMIVRWMSVDPLAAKYANASPYNFTLNNPINNIDTDGKAVKPLTSNDVTALQTVFNKYSGLF